MKQWLFEIKMTKFSRMATLVNRNRKIMSGLYIGQVFRWTEIFNTIVLSNITSSFFNSDVIIIYHPKFARFWFLSPCQTLELIFNGGISFPVEFIKVRTVRHLVPLRSRRHSDVNKRRVDGTRRTNWYKMMTSSQTLCNLKIILPFVSIVLFSRKYA